MSLAPDVGEQAALYVEIFSYSALSLITIMLGAVTNWRSTDEIGAVLARLTPPQIAGINLAKTITVWLGNWQDEKRRVRRFMTNLVAAAFMASMIGAGCILTLAGTYQRADGVGSEWQRWAGYGFGFLFTTAAMCQYFAIETVATLLLMAIGAVGMGFGTFVSLTSVGTNGGKAKVVFLSVIPGIFLLALIPLFYIFSGLAVLKRWWRGFPILVHIAFAYAVWIVLWAGPEVGSNDNPVGRTSAGWAYYVIVLLWYSILLLFFYFWKIAEPKRRTTATDAIIVDYVPGTGDIEKGTEMEEIKRVVNLDPTSPYYKPPPELKPGPNIPLQPETVRASVYHHHHHQQQQQHPSQRVASKTPATYVFKTENCNVYTGSKPRRSTSPKRTRQRQVSIKQKPVHKKIAVQKINQHDI